MGQPVGVRVSPSAPFPFPFSEFPMQAQTLGELFSHPSFQTLFLAILIVIANIIIGASMLPKDKRKKLYGTHTRVYGAVLAALAVFLFINWPLLGNSWFHYLVFGYFLIVVPLSRKLNVTLHAVVASVGLILLLSLVTLYVL